MKNNSADLLAISENIQKAFAGAEMKFRLGFVLVSFAIVPLLNPLVIGSEHTSLESFGHIAVDLLFCRCVVQDASQE